MNKTILVVDDNKANLMNAGEILHGSYKLAYANSGELAIKYLERNIPDLVLLDIMMPGMDGFEVMSRIMANENWRRIPVIFLTADRAPETEVKCLASGAVDFIGKPFDPNIMSSRVQRTIELEELRRNLADRVAELMREQEEIIKKQERVEAELSVASSVQQGMLPDLSAFSGNPHFEVAAYMKPAKEIGGDFYDFFTFGEDKMALTVADVSGKGMPAAMFMSSVKTCLRAYSKFCSTTSEIIARANNMLCLDNVYELFVTVWSGILDYRTGLLSYTNGGHNPPLIRQNGGSFEYVRNRHGSLLAVFENQKYGDSYLRLSHGDTLFIYTDGITEQMDSEKNLYGEERLNAALNANASLPPSLLIEAVRADISSFAGGAEQFDDMTMLCLRYMEE